MSVWKLLGLAGLAGVAGVIGVAATTGVIAARRRRTWSEIEPDELRRRLHDRLATASSPGASPGAASSPGDW